MRTLSPRPLRASRRAEPWDRSAAPSAARNPFRGAQRGLPLPPATSHSQPGSGPWGGTAAAHGSQRRGPAVGTVKPQVRAQRHLPCRAAVKNRPKMTGANRGAAAAPAPAASPRRPGRRSGPAAPCGSAGGLGVRAGAPRGPPALPIARLRSGRERGPSPHAARAGDGRIAPSSPRRASLHRLASRRYASRFVAPPRTAARPCGARPTPAARAGRRRTFQTPHAAAGAAGSGRGGRGQTAAARAGPSGKRSSRARSQRATARRLGLHFPWGAARERPPQSPPAPSPRRHSGGAGAAIRDVVWLCGR